MKEGGVVWFTDTVGKELTLVGALVGGSILESFAGLGSSVIVLAGESVEIMEGSFSGDFVGESFE